MNAEYSLNIRSMRLSDIERVLEIEKKSFSRPWNHVKIRDCLEAKYSCKVAEKSGKVLGYGIMKKLCSNDAEILNCAVEGSYQRMGLGKKLVNHLLSCVNPAGRGFVFLEVRESNNTAINMYENLKFIQIGRRKNYYFHSPDKREDAIIMRKEI
tara:strand:- start:77 stop:538 length:462 start_codon:yes stop_codon:yes gene_type:complete